ncbi:MAG: helix-turn-helix domain-containing protein [Runella slithyformis]|nr:MAG: helix-turn-helix domain-containing protein [Runella slithyformis]TAF95266.1 MAG: helix-turn-helix domain-containing protein [Runella sp.]TAG18544.1 MAG: helix-turn-helix domain-containing protein [Cytophagales bacterium]TAG37993.1 MAG: helix-turn-helix domain-containing protein [Cytophagia bacterium]TAE95271.1 MAG: helix-turn-helix domain-containing protein [Runella slithyformis]
MNEITEKIRLLRLQKGYSQENMADLLGVSTTAYGDIERGKTEITLARLAQMAEVFHTSVGDVLGITSPVAALEKQNRQLELEKLQIENEKLRLENQYLREKLIGKALLDTVQPFSTNPHKNSERPRIGF